MSRPSMRFVLATLVALCSTALAKPTDTWLDDLSKKVAKDLADGKPLVVEVHVPLCDSSIIACGNAKLGDGDNPDTNLYWSTTPGFGEWFDRRGGGWTRVSAVRSTEGDILATNTYRRTMVTPSAWQKAGAPKKFELDVIVHAWRGKSIDRALAQYAADISGKSSAQIVAWVGHNRLMDLEQFTWPDAGPETKGAIAIACDTAPYMKREVSAATRVPLLMTADLLFANAAPLEAAVLAFASGGTYAKIRLDAATAYAGVRKREVKHVFGAFTNPSDARW